MKATISLERDFLHRQFRSVRHALAGKKRSVTVFSASHSPSQKKDVKKTITKQKDLLRNSKIQIEWGRLRRAGLMACMLVSLVALIILFAPTVYYSLFPGDPIPVRADQSGTPLGGAFANGSARATRQIAEPAYDAHLPEGNWLIIPKIGVNTEILDGQDSAAALDKGVWRVPDFGLPTDLSKPMILAAHRYGWKAWWSNGNDYWRYHSFYLLPSLVPGDLVEVISDKRKYVYEVYAGEEAEVIGDYNADLILYTCKFLNSPQRFFRYARLVDPNKLVSSHP